MKLQIAAFLVAAALLLVSIVVSLLASGRGRLTSRAIVFVGLALATSYLLTSDNLITRALLTSRLPPGVGPGADLQEMELTNASLLGADLRGSNLSSSNLRGSSLFGANLAGATLTGADLQLADLDEANLASAILGDANLTGASLKRADLSGAILLGTTLREADLSGVEGLSASQLYDAILDRATTRLPPVPGFSWEQYESVRAPEPTVKQPTELPRELAFRGVNFAFASAELTESDQEVLVAIAGVLRANPQIRLRIVGHADSIGDGERNIELSISRSRAVVDYLLAQGISADQVVAPEGRGSLEAVATNATADGRALNRRVEFVIVPR